MLHDDLYAYLTTTPSIKALFPGGIYHQSLPQSVDRWPAMSFFLVTEQEVAEDMEAPNDDKMDQAQYQFDVVADTSASAGAAADTFRTILRNFRGTMTTTRVQSIYAQNRNHLEEKVGDKLRRRVSMDFSITYDV